MASVSRGLLLILALVACAWFALSARQARDTSRASALVSGGHPLSAQEAQRTRSLLAAAATLNPDLSVELLRGRLAFDQRNYALAERIFDSVTRAEPMNLEAWTGLLYAAAAAGHRATLVRAVRHISELYPRLK